MMKIDENKKVRLNSPHFDDMRRDLDVYITQALKAMDEKKMSSASIGLKIDIATIQKTVKDANSPTGERLALMPDITYKLALTLQAKADKKGNVVRTDHELIRDDAGTYFIVTKEEASGQLNMFNSYDELPDDVYYGEGGNDDSAFDEDVDDEGSEEE